MTAAVRALLESLDIDPDTALCPATIGRTVRCSKPFDGHTTHLGSLGAEGEVIW